MQMWSYALQQTGYVIIFWFVNPRVMVEQMSEPVMVSYVRLSAAVGLYCGVHT